jgi:hypothetical protein
VLVAATVALCALPSAAHAGTYEVASCGAPGGQGANLAWSLSFKVMYSPYWNGNPRCPVLELFSEHPQNVTMPYLESAAYELEAPPGAVLDKMVIWRRGYHFGNDLQVQGLRADNTPIGGYGANGEYCSVPAGEYVCDFGADGGVVDAARGEFDLETTKISYSGTCYGGGGCQTAGQLPVAGIGIAGSIVTVRDEGRPEIVPGGPLLEPGLRTTDAPLTVRANDPVGVRQVRVLVDGAPVHSIDSACDFRRMAPCDQVSERPVTLGDALPDGTHTVSVEATDTAGNAARTDHRVSIDRYAPALAFAPSSGRGRKVVVEAPDPGSGTVSGSIEVKRGATFRALPTTLRSGRLTARLAGSRAGRTFRATATDALGRSAQIVGAPVRLRAGFGRRVRSAVNGDLRDRPVVSGKLRAWNGDPLAGRPVTVLSRLRVDGAPEQVVARLTTNPRGAFRATLPAGASRAVRVISTGEGLQSGLRRLRFRVPWDTTLRIRPRSIPRGGRMFLAGRLRHRGFRLPATGARVELQAFERGRWRVFATTHSRGRRAAWRASYRFTAGVGRFPIRARIPYNGAVPLERGYSRQRVVRVG